MRARATSAPLVLVLCVVLPPVMNVNETRGHDSRSDAMDASPLWVPQSAMALGVTILTVAFVDEFVQVVAGRDPARNDLSADLQHME